MDNLTHSLVGLASAKAGLEKLSPYATTVCVISANAADADFISLFLGDRWTLLQHHRGITHSIVGTIAIGVLVATVAFAIERISSTIRKRPPRIRFGGLLMASLIASATHPLMDWTNNYGVRPFLPWSGRWFYGDLVYIVDPYIWLLLGTVVFLLTSDTRLKIAGWCLLAVCATVVIGIAGRPGVPESTPLRIALVIWIVVVSAVATMRALGAQKKFGAKTALAALATLVLYWGLLTFMHRSALADAQVIAANIAAARSERVLRVAVMPNAATFFRWQSIAETDQAMYRFTVGLGNMNRAASADGQVVRYAKPTGQESALVQLAEQDRRAHILHGFARFPLAHADVRNCIGQTLVQFADLRYTEPGRGRGNFSVNIPVDCPSPD
jgi:inner membrane protein